MKRVSAIVSATAAVAFFLSGCGTETDGGSEASESSTAASTSNSAEPSRTDSTTETQTTPEPDEEETETTRDEETAEPGEEDTEPNGAQTTCNQFAALDENAQITLIEQILAENPESSFAGSPNAALGTAKLVCNSESAADDPVAVAAEILPR